MRLHSNLCQFWVGLDSRGPIDESLVLSHLLYILEELVDFVCMFTLSVNIPDVFVAIQYQGRQVLQSTGDVLIVTPIQHLHLQTHLTV